jgi:PAS domain S-box-containing protein
MPDKQNIDDALRVAKALNLGDEEMELRFRQIVDNMGEAFFMASPDLQQFLYVSPAYETIWGRTRESLYAAPVSWFQSIYKADRRTVMQIATSLGQSKKQVTFEYRIMRPNGDLRWIRSRILGLRDENGVHYRSVGFSEDITEQKKASDALQQAHDELERRVAERTEALRLALEDAQAANRAKSEFLANMSHEIRTPINGMLGMAQLLGHTVLSDEQQEYIDLLQSSGDLLMRVVNDVLDFSKIEAGKLEIEQIPFSLQEAVSGTLSSLGLRAGEKGLQLRHQMADDVPDLLVGDPARLQQILFNLVGNAIKFTETGQVDVVFEQMSEGGNTVVIITSVTDTGIGIPEDKQAVIFEAFSQADTSHTRQYGGTGLGLAITSRLVEMMGGTLGVESVEGKGSTFRFSLTLEKYHKDTLPSRKKNATFTSQSMNLLLAEDNPVNQRLAVRLLEKEGHVVTVVDTGKKVLDILLLKSFDAILMDVQMPELDGLETTLAIRRDERRTGRHMPIVALTAHAMTEDRQRCLQAGMDAYISKPIVIEELHNILEEIGKKIGLS